MTNLTETRKSREYVNTFRKSGSLQPGNVLVTNNEEYTIERVDIYGAEVWLTVNYSGLQKVIKLQGIDYVFIKLYL
jgi:hypothetical protein